MRRALTLLACTALGCSIEAAEGEVGIYQAPAGDGGSAALPDPALPKPVLFLTLALRDFKRFDADDPTTNPAFANGDSEKSVVESALGPDLKPVYRPPLTDEFPTFGQQLFDQWYRDEQGTNHTVIYPLPMNRTEDGGYEFDSTKTGQPDHYQGVERRVFFPIDDGSPYATPFGNQGAPHNQGFTAELHASFTLAAGATIEVLADDDLYLFIDDQLALDLGGTHAAKAATVSLDELALPPGLHTLHVFYAERMGATGQLALKTSFELTSTVD